MQYRTWQADVALRLAGLVACGVAVAAAARLAAVLPDPNAPEIAALGLAAIGFLTSSAGVAMTCLGHHLFDQVEISPRWHVGTAGTQHAERPTSPSRRQAQRPAGSGAFGQSVPGLPGPT